MGKVSPTDAPMTPRARSSTSNDDSRLSNPVPPHALMTKLTSEDLSAASLATRFREPMPHRCRLLQAGRR